MIIDHLPLTEQVEAYTSKGGVSYIQPQGVNGAKEKPRNTAVSITSGGYGIAYFIAGFSGITPGTLDLQGLNGVTAASTYASTTGGKGEYETGACFACGNKAPEGPVNVVGGNEFYYRYEPGSEQDNWYNSSFMSFSGAQYVVENFTDKLGIVENGGTMSASIAAIGNAGNITAIINDNTMSGEVAGIFNDADGTVGLIENRGKLNGPYSLLNMGSVGSVKNTGTMSPLLNFGTITGSAALGDNTRYVAAGDRSVLGGVLSWNGEKDGKAGHGVSLAIGDADNIADLTTASVASAYVDTLSVTEGSRLTWQKDADWHVLGDGADAIRNAGTLVLNSGSDVKGNLTNTGTLMLSTEERAAATLTGNLVNSGSLVLNPTSHSAGNTLTIDGNYTGVAGSSVSLGGVLAGDDSLTDKLVITGDSSGESALSIANENGSGAQTLEGIQVVEVKGTSGAKFSLTGRVVAGAYDYTLQKGNASGTDDKDWYLTSYLTPVDPVTPHTVHMVRPEAATYADNLRTANTMFVMGLRDRQGENRDTDAVNGEAHSTSMWMRNVGGRNKSSMSDGQNKTSANRYVMQLGGDVMSWNDDAAGQLSLGVMGGYANQKSNTHNSLTGNRSTGSVSGYSAGLYGTWYQDTKSKAGVYADSWLQYAWFNNEVKGQDLAPETYKSKGLMASAETGYNLRLISWLSGNDMTNSLWLQPRAQVIWTGVKADDHTEYNGTHVQGSGSDNVQTRLGLRTYLNGKSVKDKDTARTFQPFVEANWVYNTKQSGVSMNGASENITGSRNVGELKAGVEGKLSNNLSLWTDVSQQMGGNGYSDTQGTLGVKYNF